MSYLTLSESAAPSQPANGKGSHYVSLVGESHFVNDLGVDINLTPNRKYNWVRNSGFWFLQRQGVAGAATYSNTSGRAPTVDGWGVTNENASAQVARTDTSGAPESGLVGRYYGQFTKITSTGKLIVSQVLDASDVGALRGSTVRVQLWAKAIVSVATWRLALVQLTSAGTVDTIPATFVSAFGSNTVDPTLGTALSYIAPKAGITPDNATASGNAASMAVTASWQRFGAVFDVPTDCKNLVLLVFSDSQVLASSGIAISQLSITDGQAVQDWAPLAYQEELERVQRFYAKSFALDTAPAQNSGTLGQQRGHVSVAGITANQPIGIRFPVPMRSTSPTMTFYNPSAANAFVRNSTAGTDATATAAANTTDVGTDVIFTGIAAWTVAQAVAIHYSADAEL